MAGGKKIVTSRVRFAESFRPLKQAAFFRQTGPLTKSLESREMAGFRETSQGMVSPTRITRLILLTCVAWAWSELSLADVFIRNLSSNTIWVARSVRDRTGFTTTGYRSIASGSQSAFNRNDTLLIIGAGGVVQTPGARSTWSADRQLWYHPQSVVNIRQNFNGEIFVNGTRRDANWMRQNGYRQAWYVGWADGTIVRFGNAGYPANPNATAWLEGKETQSFSHSTSGWKYETFGLRFAQSHKLIHFQVNVSCSRQVRGISWSIGGTKLWFTGELTRGWNQASPCYKGTVDLFYVYPRR